MVANEHSLSSLRDEMATGHSESTFMRKPLTRTRGSVLTQSSMREMREPLSV